VIGTTKLESIIMSKLPQYFSYQRSEGPKDVTVTTLDLNIDQSIIPPNKDLLVFGDEVTVCGKLATGGHHITINARKINFLPGGGIDTSGKPPSDPGTRAKDGGMNTGCGSAGENGTGGQPGSPGNNAGNITLIAAEYGETHFVPMSSEGGKGGKGQDGGNGGRGHDGQPGADAQIRRAQFDRIIAQPTAGGPGGAGGKGGDAGKSGNGGNGGHIRVGHMGQAPSIAPSCKPGAAGDDATPGQGGAAGTGGQGGRKAECHNHACAGEVTTDCDLIDARVASGANGAAGMQGAKFKAAAGNTGTLAVVPIVYADLLSTYPSSLEQRMLTFHKMKLAYLAGDYQGTKRLLTWLKNVTPSTGASPDWVQLHTRVTTLLAQFNQGLDYFGRSRMHVPLVSLRYYQVQLASLLSLGGQVEQVYLRYLDAEKDQQKQQAAVESALESAQSSLKALDNVKQNASAEKTRAQDCIASITEEQVAQELVLTKSNQDFQDALTRYFQIEVLKDFFSIMVSLVTIGADVFSAGKAIVNLCDEVAKDAAEFKNLIKQVKTIGGSASDICKNWKIIKDQNTPENPDTSKLIMKKEEFDAVMKQFVDTIPEAKAYEDEVHKYIEIIQSRNQKVIEYNAFALQEMSIAAEIAQKASEIETIKQDWVKNKDPGASRMRMYMLNLYADLKENILAYLYQENQAYRYWSLTWHDFSVGDNSIAELSAYHVDLSGKILDLLNARGKPVQPFKKAQVILKRADLPNAFERLRSKSRLSFSIPLSGPHLDGLAQAIATDFTVELKNAHTNDDKIYILMTSSGRAPFLDINGKEFIFSHAPVTALYEYQISSGECLAGGKLGGDDGEYIGLSPFTTWTLELPAKFNHGLKLDDVDEIVINFSGRALPMNTNALKNATLRVANGEEPAHLEQEAPASTPLAL